MLRTTPPAKYCHANKERLAGRATVEWAASAHNLGALHMANGEFAVIWRAELANPAP